MLTEFNWMETTLASPIFLALIAASVLTLAIAAERAIYFWKRRGDADEALQRALSKVSNGKTSEAQMACENTSHPFGVVGSEVMREVPSRWRTLEERMQVVLSEQKLLLERNLNVLGTLAAIAPLIGLLGTVWGIMRAFHDMAATGSAAPSIVASGVAEALITTAAGLVVAVPALILYNHFSRRMNVMLTVAENHARSLSTALLSAGEDRREEQRRESGYTDSYPAGAIDVPEPSATR